MPGTPKRSIESMRKAQQKLVDQVSSIDAQLEALKQKKADSLKAQKKMERELQKAEKAAVSAERRKNRNVRTRNLIQLAGDVLNLFPDLKNQFEASVTKDDYNRNGEIARRKIITFISSKKGLPIPAAESKNIIDSDSPAHDETPSAVPPQPESRIPFQNEEITPNPDTMEPLQLDEVPGKVCPQCGAQALQALDRYHYQPYYFCANSKFWKYGSKNCNFKTDTINDLKDAPVPEKK